MTDLLAWELRSRRTGQVVDRATRLSILMRAARQAVADYEGGKPSGLVYDAIHAPTGTVVASWGAHRTPTGGRSWAWRYAEVGPR